jgi:hypothetical protein
VFPISRILVAVACVLERAKAMAFVTFPLSSMSISVDPLVGALAMLFALFPFSDVHISVDPLVGAVAMMLAFFPFSDVLISVDVLEAALAFGVEGAEEQAQEHHYKRDPIGEKNYDATESDSCCICNESDSCPLVGAVAVGKEHRYKRYTKSRECGEERKFMTQQKGFVLIFYVNRS